MPSIQSIYSIIAAIVLGCTSLQAQAPQYEAAVLIKPSNTTVIFPMDLNNKGESTTFMI